MLNNAFTPENCPTLAKFVLKYLIVGLVVYEFKSYYIISETFILLIVVTNNFL